MTFDALTAPKLVKLNQFPIDPVYKLRIARADLEPSLREAVSAGHFEVQAGGWTRHYATLTLIGSEATPRPVASLAVSLRQFEEVVRYDPSDPPVDEGFGKEYKAYHDKTQSDFTGAKQKNLLDYLDYGLEALRGERQANIPEINGWVDVEASAESLFVVLHTPEEGLFYGMLFLKSVRPVMQSDGQTQTAMLFRLATTKLGTRHTDTFRVKLEVEFGVTPEMAGQAFADRNGRGTKKNRNLVQDLTVIGGISQLVKGAIAGTTFEGRTFDGRGAGVSETSTNLILDLATMENIVMNVCTDGAAKPEHVKTYHVDTFMPFVKDFVNLLLACFKEQWKEKTEPGDDPFRAIYVHGWSFSFKALSKAYFRTRINEIGPLADAMRNNIDLTTEEPDTEEAWKARAAELLAKDLQKPEESQKYVPTVTAVEFEKRLKAIDWVRHRKHWVDITGFTRDKDGDPNTKTLKNGTVVVKTKAPTQAEVITGMIGKILGPKWTDLTAKADYPVEEKEKTKNSTATEKKQDA